MKHALLAVVFAAGCSGSSKKPDSGELVIPSTGSSQPPRQEPASDAEIAAGGGGAEAQAEIARKLDEEGVAAMNAGKYGDASAKFREAVARAPDARYFYNLCTALFMEGKFAEALAACRGVAKNAPSAQLQTKTEKLIGRIHDEANKQGVAVE